MSVHGPHTQSTMTTKEMAKSFPPIILFSIVLPFVDIITDLRMIFILYSRPLPYCIKTRDFRGFYVYNSECLTTNDIETFCRTQPNLCNFEIHKRFATMLLGEYRKVLPSRLSSNSTEFSSILVKLYCFIHNLVSDGEEQDLDICSATT